MTGLTDVLSAVMSLAQTTSRRRAVLQRRFRRPSFLSWRRVATGAGGLLAAALAYHVVVGQNGLTAYDHKRQESSTLSRDAALLTKENDFYRGHVARLQSDPGAIEHQAREELHYTRPGEVIYTLPPPAQTTPDRR